MTEVYKFIIRFQKIRVIITKTLTKNTRVYNIITSGSLDACVIVSKLTSVASPADLII